METQLASVTITVPRGSHDLVMSTYRWLIERTRVQPGLLGCGLFEEQLGSGRLLFITEWSSRAELESYLRSDHFTAVLSMLELSSEEPNVRIHELKEPRGLGYVERARNKKGGR